MKRKMLTVLRNDEDGSLYCQDGKMRTLAPLGTHGFCMKIWRKPGFARRAAEKYGLRNYTLTHFYPEKGESINQLGEVVAAT